MQTYYEQSKLFGSARIVNTLKLMVTHEGNVEEPVSSEVATYDEAGNIVIREEFQADGSPLLKQVLTYTSGGKPSTEHHYHADGSSVLRKVWTYNNDGNLIKGEC